MENNYGLSGLTNIGNTCYLNSIIQCLSHSSLIRYSILNNNFNLIKLKENINNDIHFLKNINSSIYISLHNILQLLWNNSSVINPTNFYVLIQNITNNFKVHSQQDSSEFLYFLIERLDSEISYNIEIDKQLIKSDNIDDKLKTRISKSIDCFSLFLKHKDSFKYSFFKQIIYGIKTRLIICGNCKTMTETFDIYLLFQLNIPEESTDPLTLCDCFNNYCKKQQLDSTEKFFCNKCDQCVSKAYSWEKLWNTPPIFVIHLLRFINDNANINKQNTSIKIPLNLNIKEYTDDSYYKYLENNNIIFTYELYAACCHIGNTNNGHYFTVIKKDNKWYNIDDESVFKISSFDKLYEILNSYSYILFYNKNK